MIDSLSSKRDAWRGLEAKTKEEKRRSCWIAPKGEWFNVLFAEHTIFAIYVLEDLYPAEYPKDDLSESGVILRKKGWILVHDDWASGTILYGWENMTPDQYIVLYDFFGDEPLFRGWTIKRFWERAKNKEG